MNNQNLQDLFEQTQENFEVVPQFIEALLESEVYCLGAIDSEKKYQFRMLQSENGDEAIPFFISDQMIKYDVGEDEKFFSMNARELFKLTQGTTLVLNPTSELIKAFTPEEVETILNMEFDEL